jgi:DAACS family dicarboxylate/amino acid:cation (Na+ or H+) symporter
MTVVPLVFSSLLIGVASLGDVRKLGRIGLKCFGYCLVISCISVIIGLTLANTIQPGKRIAPATALELQRRYASDASKRVEEMQKSGATDSPMLQVIKTLVPTNPLASIASETPNMLHLMFFTLMLGIAMTLVPAERTAPLLRAAVLKRFRTFRRR